MFEIKNLRALVLAAGKSTRIQSISGGLPAIAGGRVTLDQSYKITSFVEITGTEV